MQYLRLRTDSGSSSASFVMGTISHETSPQLNRKSSAFIQLITNSAEWWKRAALDSFRNKRIVLIYALWMELDR